jgi:hypothetical protein
MNIYPVLLTVRLLCALISLARSSPCREGLQTPTGHQQAGVNDDTSHPSHESNWSRPSQ